VRYEIMNLVPRAENWSSILGAPNSTRSGRVIMYVLLKKISYHQIALASRCKGVGIDLSLLVNHK
jgi:hypothetical protein